MLRPFFTIALFFVLGVVLMSGHSYAEAPLPSWVHNQLLDATISSNIERYNKGVRGAPRHIIYDFERKEFAEPSSWHEFGVDANANLGVIPEDSPVWWMAEWNTPIKSNRIELRGCYPNQPQPDTAWKIEVRRDGQWYEHARGQGGWYDNGRYSWTTPEETTVEFDAFRVSVFSKDDSTPLTSIHFRGEDKGSWLVAQMPTFEVQLETSKTRVRLGDLIQFTGTVKKGDIDSWHWDLGDGSSSTKSTVKHAYKEPGNYDVVLTFQSEGQRAKLNTSVIVRSPIQAQISFLDHQVMVGQPVDFEAAQSLGPIKEYTWNFDDGQSGKGKRTQHTFEHAGIYEVRLAVSGNDYTDECTALIRVHTDETRDIPQVLLDSDQKNEQDDQYFLGYSVFSQLDILGVNSVHHGGGQEPVNFAEIEYVLDLCKQSGAPDNRIPRVFRGANERLSVPDNGVWSDTAPIDTAAAQAILATARGASPENPAWVVPVGPGTNVASAILLAKDQGLELKGRLKVMWLGGSNDAITSEFNGNNDPWSLYVIAQSGIECWIMPAPVGARVRIDKRTESDWFADNPLGQYLKKITPSKNKPLFDPAVISAIISMHLQEGWIRSVEHVRVSGPEDSYRWYPAHVTTNVKVIREIKEDLMKKDIFDTLKGKPQSLPSKKTYRDNMFIPPIKRTHLDVSYGPHERNLMDVWIAESDTPTPVLISIHGGGFRHGNKKVGTTLLRECLEAGISVVSISYRYSTTDIAPAQFHDAARALQFVRHNAKEWNIDPTRIAATGSSAGAGLSLWLGFHDDMADPDNTDPVLRHSTRLTCMAVDQGQSSYDPRFIRELIPENDTYATGPLVLLYGVDIAKDLDSLPQEKYDLFEETSALPHLTADDTAPVLLTYVSSLDTPVTDRGIGIHHPRFGEALKKEMDALNLDCTFRDGIPKDSPERSDLMFAFIKKHLFENHS